MKRHISIGLLIGVALSLVVGITFIIGSGSTLLALLGVYVSITISVIVAMIDRLRALERGHNLVARLTRDEDLQRMAGQLIRRLSDAVEHQDPLYRELLSRELRETDLRLAQAATGVITFKAESWRAAWRDLLGSDDVAYYHSVALVKNRDYWQDNAGRDAMVFNKEIATSIGVHRIFVIWDNLWQDTELHSWIASQRDAGITVSVVRRSDIPAQEDLIHDLGIYGDRAVGYQHLDEQCHTLRFELRFDEAGCLQAIDRFRRLKLYATEEATNEYFETEVVSSMAG